MFMKKYTRQHNCNVEEIQNNLYLNSSFFIYKLICQHQNEIYQLTFQKSLAKKTGITLKHLLTSQRY